MAPYSQRTSTSTHTHTRTCGYICLISACEWLTGKLLTENVERVHGEPAELNLPTGGIFPSVKGGSLWTAGVYEVLSLSWRHRDTRTHTLRRAGGQTHTHTLTRACARLLTIGLFVYTRIVFLAADAASELPLQESRSCAASRDYTSTE